MNPESNNSSNTNNMNKNTNTSSNNNDDVKASQTSVPRDDELGDLLAALDEDIHADSLAQDGDDILNITDSTEGTTTSNDNADAIREKKPEMESKPSAATNATTTRKMPPEEAKNATTMKSPPEDANAAAATSTSSSFNLGGLDRGSDDAPMPPQYLEEGLPRNTADRSGDGKVRSFAGPATAPRAVAVGGGTSTNTSDRSGDGKVRSSTRPATTPGAVGMGGAQRSGNVRSSIHGSATALGTAAGTGGNQGSRGGELAASLQTLNASGLEMPPTPSGGYEYEEKTSEEDENNEDKGEDEGKRKSKIVSSITGSKYKPIPGDSNYHNTEDEGEGRSFSQNQNNLLRANLNSERERVDQGGVGLEMIDDDANDDATLNSKATKLTSASLHQQQGLQGESNHDGQQFRPPNPLASEEQTHSSFVRPGDDSSNVQFYSVEAVAVPLTNSSAEDLDDSEGQAAAAASTNAGPGREGSVRYVYSATLVTPWWKEPKRMACYGVIVLMIGASIALGLAFNKPVSAPSPDDGPDGPPPTVTTLATTPSPTTQTPTSSPTKPPPPMVHGIANVTYLRSLYETDCGSDKESKCWPYVEVNGDTAIMAPITINPFNGQVLEGKTWDQQIFFFNKTASRTLAESGDEDGDGGDKEDGDREDGGNFELVQTLDVTYQPGVMTLVGDTLAVGANQENLQAGAVYIYGRNETGHWEERQHIVPKDARVDAEFGYMTKIEDDVMVIGAHQDREGKIGSVYIYRKNEEKDQWEFEQKLAPSNEEGKIFYFGMVVAIKNNRIAIGDRAYQGYAEDEDSKGPKRKGGVWLYEYDRSSKKWTMTGDVMTNPYCDNFFGEGLDFTYDSGLLVGCTQDDEGGKGSVYYYTPSDSGEYVFQQKIVASDRFKSDNFGGSNGIAVYSNVMVVGTDTKKKFPSIDSCLHIVLARE